MVNVLKADGSIEPFSEEKVLRSIRRAGVSPEVEAKVLQVVKEKLYENIPTYDVYGIIADTLAHSGEPYSRARYSLKQAIMLLGPTGYPFEDFIGKLLEEVGYSVQTRQLLNGRCVDHEVDVIAEKDGKKSLIEAKFHNNPGTRSDVRVALYVKSRFEDLKDRYNFDDAWIITNTKTTTDANTYSECSGIKIMSWNFPEGESLRDLIESAGLQPITILTTLNAHQKAQLLANHVIMCKDIESNPSHLDILGLSREEREQTLKEVTYICSLHKHSARHLKASV